MGPKGLRAKRRAVMAINSIVTIRTLIHQAIRSFRACMNASATECSLQDVLRWRDLYRQEMNCQITKDSIHSRDGWTREFLLSLGGTKVGYGSVAVAGPW